MYFVNYFLLSEAYYSASVALPTALYKYVYDDINTFAQTVPSGFCYVLSQVMWIFGPIWLQINRHKPRTVVDVF